MFIKFKMIIKFSLTLIQSEVIKVIKFYDIICRNRADKNEDIVQKEEVHKVHKES